jgi:hypothetical protein
MNLYIDLSGIWYIIRGGILVALAGEKFGGDFNDRLFLGQLVSLEDVKTQEIDFLRDPVDRKTIESFLKTTVRNFKL